ncbi:MAG: hypothetical protein ABI612_10065, partial [Betaproteobacteria bacterium]
MTLDKAHGSAVSKRASALRAPRNESALEPWQWSETQWRNIVGHVRAGRTLRPQRWQNGARCAV